MIELVLNDDLIWSSDWSGDEVGHPDVEIVGLYQLRGTDVHFYIDVIEGKILEAWQYCEECDG